MWWCPGIKAYTYDFDVVFEFCLIHSIQKHLYIYIKWMRNIKLHHPAMCIPNTANKPIIIALMNVYLNLLESHYNYVTMRAMASQITDVSIVCQTVVSGGDQRKHQSSESTAFMREFTGDRWIPRTKASNAEMFLFDDVIMVISADVITNHHKF